MHRKIVTAAEEKARLTTEFFLPGKESLAVLRIAHLHGCVVGRAMVDAPYVELLHRYATVEAHVDGLVGIVDAARGDVAFYAVATVKHSAVRQHLWCIEITHEVNFKNNNVLCLV